MYKIPFVKMHGQGNDYVYIFEEDLPGNIDLKLLSIEISKKHFGIGSDGLVIIRSDDSDLPYMEMYNSDGSQAEMCGTALRCTAYILFQRFNKNEWTINTMSGIKNAWVYDDQVKVNMGIAELISDQCIQIEVNNRIFSGYYVNIGNPHFVVFEKMDHAEDLKIWGPLLENHPYFKDKANIEFVEIIDHEQLRVNVWERGSGITLACGTGATASVYTAVTQKNIIQKCKVHLPGGIVTVILDNNKELFLIGSVSKVMSGIYYYKED